MPPALKTHYNTTPESSGSTYCPRTDQNTYLNTWQIDENPSLLGEQDQFSRYSQKKGHKRPIHSFFDNAFEKMCLEGVSYDFRGGGFLTNIAQKKG